MGKTAIEVISYSYRAGRRDILKDISFSVEEGDYLSILGPNGAGKSTLLKSITRLIGYGSGVIRLYGQDVRKISAKRLAGMVSYVPQVHRLSFPITVWQFVLLSRYPYLSPLRGVSSSDRDAVDRALRMTGLYELRERALNTLSGGEQQKAYLAAAVAQDTKVILLDEPTTFLDPRYKQEMMALVERLNIEEKVTIIEVTHDINLALLFSRRIMALKDGELFFSGSPKSLLEGHTLRSLYDTGFAFAEHPEMAVSLVFPRRRREDDEPQSE
jgi:iron complex transport system ATP-binding protein